MKLIDVIIRQATDRETPDQFVHNPQVIEYNNHTAILSIGTHDTVSTYADNAYIYVLSINPALGYFTLETFQIEDLYKDSEITLDEYKLDDSEVIAMKEMDNKQLINHLINYLPIQ